jgi:hypothetical protein
MLCMNMYLVLVPLYLAVARRLAMDRAPVYVQMQQCVITAL